MSWRGKLKKIGSDCLSTLNTGHVWEMIHNFRAIFQPPTPSSASSPGFGPSRISEVGHQFKDIRVGITRDLSIHHIRSVVRILRERVWIER